MTAAQLDPPITSCRSAADEVGAADPLDATRQRRHPWTRKQRGPRRDESGARPKASDPIRAFGGPRYAVALLVDALGSGMLRPFLLLYGIKVLSLGVAETGTAMSLGMVFGLVALPFAGRWIDRGARSSVVAAAMSVRVVGVAVLLLSSGVGGFTVAALFLGIGNQCWSPAHAALVTTVADERHRDAALAAGRSLRNAGMGAGALIASVCMAGGTGALRILAFVSALGYVVAASLAGSLRIVGDVGGTARPEPLPASTTDRRTTRVIRRPRGPHMTRPTVLEVANLPYAFCFNVLEVALPAVLVTRLNASPAWSAGIYVGNTVLVVTTQIAVVTWMSRYARHTVLAASGFVLAASYLGFWAAEAVPGWGAAATVAAVSIAYTAGEILYTGSATALIAATTPPHLLGHALSRFQLTNGIGLAVSPAVFMALLVWGTGVLWTSLAVATLAAAATVHRSGRT